MNWTPTFGHLIAILVLIAATVLMLTGKLPVTEGLLFDALAVCKLVP